MSAAVGNSAATAPRYYLRPSSRDLGEMPLDVDALSSACAELRPRELGVWLRLKRHLWCYGELPMDLRRLASIGNVTPKSFERMQPALAPLFDHDRHGRWRDLDLEEARNLRLEIEPCERPSFEAPLPGEAPPTLQSSIDPTLSAVRSKSGTKGSDARWREHREKKLQLLEGGIRAASSSDGQGNELQASLEPSNLPSANSKTIIANDGKTTMANNDCLPSTELSHLPSDASCAPGSDGLTDCSSSNQIRSVSQSLTNIDCVDRCADARAAFGKPDGMLHGKPAGKVSGADSPTLPSADGKIAEGLDGKLLTDVAIANVVRRAVADGGGSLDEAWMSQACMAVLRAFVADGYDLEHHYKPALKAFTERVKDKRIRHPATEAVMLAALERRDQSQRGAAAQLKRPDVATMSPLDRSFHEAIERSLSVPEYMSWCSKMTMLFVENGVAAISVPTNFVRAWVKQKYERQLLQSAKAADPSAQRVLIEVRSHSPPSVCGAGSR